MRRPGSGRDVDFVIVGTGVTAAVMAGVLVARELARPDRVAIIAEYPLLPEVVGATRLPAPEADWDLRVFALGRASQRLLAAAGVWARLPPDKVCAYERMCVWDAEGTPYGRGSLCFDCALSGEPDLGHIVEGRALQIMSQRAANEAGVIFVEAGIAGISSDDAEVRIRLKDGREMRCQLLIAADGAESPTRTLLGIDTARHAYNQEALVAHVRTEKPHQRTARQRFLPTGPLAFLPLPDGRSSIVWSVVSREAARLRALDPAAFGAALTAASGEVLGACELTTSVASFPLELQYALNYVIPRAVLVGDAAHVVHPLAGQGLNLGFLDCAALAEVLGESERGGDWGEPRLLRRYERWRRSENLVAAAALDGLTRLFAGDDFARTRLRVAALTALDHMPFVKREFAARALGLSGDVPEFLKHG